LVAAAVNAAGCWAELVDDRWRHAFTTDELRLGWGQPFGLATVPLGAFYFSPEAVQATDRTLRPEYG